jgi:hypothetical protein
MARLNENPWLEPSLSIFLARMVQYPVSKHMDNDKIVFTSGIGNTYEGIETINRVASVTPNQM